MAIEFEDRRRTLRPADVLFGILCIGAALVVVGSSAPAWTHERPVVTVEQAVVALTSDPLLVRGWVGTAERPRLCGSRGCHGVKVAIDGLPPGAPVMLRGRKVSIYGTLEGQPRRLVVWRS